MYKKEHKFTSPIKKKVLGFTLIELLIVVAIIAILAAIAIPNFLAAQTRSKVSRSHSEMRSLTTAIESYYVDQNAYPDAHVAHITGNFNNRLQQITTPVAYITSLPADPFRAMITGLSPNPPEQGKATYEYVDRGTAVGTGPRQWNLWVNNLSFEYYFGASARWNMFSVGPDQKSPFQIWGNPLPPAGPRVDYDPTNGTVSNGDIWRWGP
ncbi:MAG: prepilin-type N-terminal cleavage/methylation domain-containing protein [bacterium]|nr:prepilin-type N-terminal cleavage/methylation domain-containing protein [bacterium]